MCQACSVLGAGETEVNEVESDPCLCGVKDNSKREKLVHGK